MVLFGKNEIYKSGEKGFKVIEDNKRTVNDIIEGKKRVLSKEQIDRFFCVEKGTYYLKAKILKFKLHTAPSKSYMIYVKKNPIIVNKFNYKLSFKKLVIFSDFTYDEQKLICDIILESN